MPLKREENRPVNHMNWLFICKLTTLNCIVNFKV